MKLPVDLYFFVPFHPMSARGANFNQNDLIGRRRRSVDAHTGLGNEQKLRHILLFVVEGDHEAGNLHIGAGEGGDIGCPFAGADIKTTECLPFQPPVAFEGNGPGKIRERIRGSVRGRGCGLGSSRLGSNSGGLLRGHFHGPVSGASTSGEKQGGKQGRDNLSLHRV